MTSTAVATVNDEPKGIRGLLQHERAKQQIMPFLRGANYEAVVQETLLAVAANPALRKSDPASLIAAVATAVRWQGVIGEDVHLVPFGDKVTPMKDYKFKAKQIVATGAARQVYAVAVYKNEPFTFTQGTQPTIQHQVILDEKARGPMVGAYAVAMIRAGQFQIRSMTVGEIDRIRQDKSKSWKSGAVPEWYALKTVIHQLAKLLPTNSKLAKLIEEDDAIEEGTLDSGPVTVVAAPDQPRLTRPVVTNLGYETLPEGERDVDDRPVPRESVVIDEQQSAEEPGAGESEAAEPVDVMTGAPLSTAGQWNIPAGDLRGRLLGTLTNDELTALHESMSEFPKKYGGTIARIEELQADRRLATEG
jgi:phage RecT family recombinase